MAESLPVWTEISMNQATYENAVKGFVSYFKSFLIWAKIFWLPPPFHKQYIVQYRYTIHRLNWNAFEFTQRRNFLHESERVDIFSPTIESIKLRQSSNNLFLFEYILKNF